MPEESIGKKTKRKYLGFDYKIFISLLEPNNSVKLSPRNTRWTVASP
jgi:hypothetical protein